MGRKENSARLQKPEEDSSAATKLGRLRKFIQRDIWESRQGGSPSDDNQWVSLLRILTISLKGLSENRLFSRAAALSYSSLIALGPLVAIIVILSSSFIQTNAETQIKRALLFIAPSLQELVTLEPKSEDAEMATALDDLLSQIVDGAEQLLNQVNTSGSKAFGAMGGIILIWVVIQLLTSVETTLNQIWGVHQGRPWSQRIVFYWTFVSLGALLGLGSTALFSASNLATMTDWVPFGSELTAALLSFSPVLSFSMLVLLLALFYQFFPNTSVKFKAALVGSLLTAVLLFLNNYLSILYVSRVISFQSLYGSVGIIPVLMIGLYFFWVLILLGGQLTYSVQNVSYLANQSAWKRISPISSELVVLSTFIFLARRFNECQPAPTIVDMGREMSVPVNILNESLETLDNMGWVTKVSMDNGDERFEETGFRPSKPLESYTLSQFKSALEQYGQSDILESLLQSDTLLKEYREALRWHETDPFCQSDLKSHLSG
jgi:membrane protein